MIYTNTRFTFMFYFKKVQQFNRYNKNKQTNLCVNEIVPYSSYIS